MELFFIIALIWGGVTALNRGAEVAGQRLKAAAAKYAKAHPSKPGRVGSTVGRGLGATAFGATEMARGFGAGVRAGFPEGRRAAQDWRDRRRERGLDGAVSPPVSPPVSAAVSAAVSPPVSPPSLAATAPAPLAPVDRNAETAGRPLAAAAAPKPADEPVQPPADRPRHRAPADEGDTPPPAPSPSKHDTPAQGEDPTTEGDDMPDTDTQRPVSNNGGRQGQPNNNRGQGDADSSGEISNYPQLIDRLQKIEDAATDDLEDAKADADRAEADLKQIEGMVASLTQLKLDQGSVGQVGQLSESGKARAEAAKARQTAAEQRATQARAARQAIEQNYRQWYEASQAAPAIPEREFADA